MGLAVLTITDTAHGETNMAIHNNLLFNAAYIAFLGGIFWQRNITDPVAADDILYTTAASAFATEVDSLIPFDAGITQAKSDLLAQICNAAMSGKWAISSLSSDYAVTAGAIAALYNEATPNLLSAAAGGLPFSSFFALMPGDNAATVAAGTAIQFPQNGPTNGAAVRATASTFTIAAAGTYRIGVQISFDEAGQWALALNGAILPDTVVGRATGTNQATIFTEIVCALHDVLSVINPAGNPAALTITPSAGGTHAVSATLSIQQIS